MVVSDSFGREKDQRSHAGRGSVTDHDLSSDSEKVQTLLDDSHRPACLERSILPLSRASLLDMSANNIFAQFIASRKWWRGELYDGAGKCDKGLLSILMMKQRSRGLSNGVERRHTLQIIHTPSICFSVDA